MSKRQEKIVARIAERDAYMKSVHTSRIEALEETLSAGEKWYEENIDKLSDDDKEVINKAREADRKALEDLRTLYKL